MYWLLVLVCAKLVEEVLYTVLIVGKIGKAPLAKQSVQHLIVLLILLLMPSSADEKDYDFDSYDFRDTKYSTLHCLATTAPPAKLLCNASNMDGG